MQENQCFFLGKLRYFTLLRGKLRYFYPNVKITRLFTKNLELHPVLMLFAVKFNRFFVQENQCFFLGKLRYFTLLRGKLRYFTPIEERTVFYTPKTTVFYTPKGKTTVFLPKCKNNASFYKKSRASFKKRINYLAN